MHVMGYHFNPFLTRKPSYANSADPDQTPNNLASDQGLHCLLIIEIEYFIYYQKSTLAIPGMCGNIHIFMTL